MKITYAITKGNWGGAQKYVFELACAAKEAGHEVSIVFGEPGKLKEYAEEAGIRTIALPHLKRDINVFKEIKSFFALIKVLREEHPDVLHLNSPKMGGLGALGAKLVGIKKVIYTAHGWTWNEDRSPLSKLLIKLASWFIILLSWKVIVLSEHEKMQVEHWPGARSKIRIIPIGIQDIDFLERNEARRLLHQSHAHVPLSSGTIWIGNIAELHKNKGLAYAIEALALLPSEIDWIYVVMGVGEEQKKLQAIIESLHLEKRIFLVGFQKYAARLLKAFDIFLFSSIKEGLPYTILEAGASGLAVISTDVGSISDIITDRSSGRLVPAKNPEMLKEAVWELIPDHKTREEYAKTLQNKIKSDFSFKKMVDNSLSSYTT